MRMNGAMKGFAMAALCSAMAGVMAGEVPVPIVPEGGLATNWMVEPGTELQAPGYPGEFAARGDDVCIAMGYRVQPDGTTSDVVMLRGWNSSKLEPMRMTSPSRSSASSIRSPLTKVPLRLPRSRS